MQWETTRITVVPDSALIEAIRETGKAETLLLHDESGAIGAELSFEELQTLLSSLEDDVDWEIYEAVPEAA